VLVPSACVGHPLRRLTTSCLGGGFASAECARRHWTEASTTGECETRPRCGPRRCGEDGSWRSKVPRSFRCRSPVRQRCSPWRRRILRIPEFHGRLEYCISVVRSRRSNGRVFSLGVEFHKTTLLLKCEGWTRWASSNDQSPCRTRRCMAWYATWSRSSVIGSGACWAPFISVDPHVDDSAFVPLDEEERLEDLAA
jgi:hypothetical protein